MDSAEPHNSASSAMEIDSAPAEMATSVPQTAPTPVIVPPHPTHSPVPQTNGASTLGIASLPPTSVPTPTAAPASVPAQETPPPPASHQATPPSKSEEKPTIHREQREKKDSWKKKEAKEHKSKPDVSTLPPLPAPIRLRPPPYRQEDINAIPRLPTFTPAYSATTPDGRALDFFRVSDQPFNRKRFRYTPCAAAPELPQLMYRQISLEPYHARINWQDMNQYILIDKDGLAVTTEKGYRMARTNVCVREGDWYVEFKIERGGGDQGGHTRIGFARRENVPVGYDGYSYGFRDVTGQKVHLSRPKPFMQPFGTGDVIGMHISLPRPINSEETGEKKTVFRDRIPIRFKGQLYFEQPDYAPSKEMDELMNPVLPPQVQNNPSIPLQKPSFPIVKDSFINVYKNGEFMGTAFEELLDFLPPASQLSGRDLDDGMLGYYPAVSVFRYGIVRLNFGPEWICPPKDLEGKGVRPMCDRYEEMLKEEKQWDLLEEIEWEKDAARMETQVGAPVTTGAEIKELTDEWT